MSSPPRDAIPSLPSLPSLATMQLHAPISPTTPRTLRKLQSAHNLGAKASFQSPSLISQQRQQQQEHEQQLQMTQEETEQPSQSHHQYLPGSPERRVIRSHQRVRSNSDAPMFNPMANSMGVSMASSMAANKRAAMSKRSAAADALSLERLLRDGPPAGDIDGAVESARFKVLETGIKADSEGMSSLRIYVWLIFLNVPILDTDNYLQLVHRGASPAYSKIRNDTFRTLVTDPLFRRRVSEASLIRLLNAVAWRLHDAREERAPSRHSLPHDSGSSRPGTGYSSRPGTGYSSRPGTGYSSGGAHSASSPAARSRARALTLTTEGSENGMTGESGTYVQGMNVLAAPFLYAARSEAEAYVAFYQLLTKECPGYIRGAMDGVHKGLALVDKVLAIVDPKLSLYLLSKGMSAEIYAFPSVLTLCACTPPLPEVLRLWDFLFAYGPHLNILCIVAQLVIIRDQILESPSPNKILGRSFPALQADQIKAATLTTIQRIPEDVYAEIVSHAQ